MLKGMKMTDRLADRKSLKRPEAVSEDFRGIQPIFYAV